MGLLTKTSLQIVGYFRAGLLEAHYLSFRGYLLLMRRLRLREVVPAQGCAGNRGWGWPSAWAVPWLHLPPPPTPE